MIGSYRPSMHELDIEALDSSGRLARLTVDSRPACLSEAGELRYLSGAKSSIVEIGACVDEFGRPLAGRDTRGQGVSVYKSVGLGPMDVAISRLVLDRAREHGVGTTLSF